MLRAGKRAGVSFWSAQPDEKALHDEGRVKVAREMLT